MPPWVLVLTDNDKLLASDRRLLFIEPQSREFLRSALFGFEIFMSKQKCHTHPVVGIVMEWLWLGSVGATDETDCLLIDVMMILYTLEMDRSVVSVS